VHITYHKIQKKKEQQHHLKSEKIKWKTGFWARLAANLVAFVVVTNSERWQLTHACSWEIRQKKP